VLNNRHVGRIASFELLLLDGNQICSGGVDKLNEVMEAANKTLGGDHLIG
jgi:hypothetical protein